MSISCDQCLAARILVHVDRSLLARESGIPVDVIEHFEKTGKIPPGSDIDELESALERLGALFIPEDDEGGAGVRLRFARDESRRISAWEGEGGASGDDDVP